MCGKKFRSNKFPDNEIAQTDSSAFKEKEIKQVIFDMKSAGLSNKWHFSK